MRLKKKFFKKYFWLAVMVAAALFVFGAIVVAVMAEGLPSVDELTSQKMVQSTKIYDKTGQILLYEISAGEKRTVVPFDEIPKTLKDATISIEDENFYNEPAFDWRGILRAVFVNITRGGVVQGGSTITQQLARNAFLTIEQTYTRKIKELLLAIKLNKYYSKDEILSLYLNQIPYGPTIYGVESASQAFFGKRVGEINLAEAAVLAALPKAPTYYSPWGNHVNDLIKRQKLVLNKMYELGKISKKELDSVLTYKVSFQPRLLGGIRAPHFVMAVQEYLVQKYGEDMVNRGGLKVITTLDYPLQEAAEKAVEAGAKRNEDLYQGKNAALVAQDPVTGQMLAMVGSRDYFDRDNEGNFNVATQGMRQPGSALKPFVYMTLFEKGLSPESVLFDVPTEFAANNPSCPPEPDYNIQNPECFHPQNFSKVFSGPIALRNALAQSINIPSVKVLYLAGMTNVLNNLHNFGITTLNEPGRYGLSLVLGGGEIKLIDLVGAYSVLAEEGVRHQQSLILEVKDGSGKVLESFNDKKETVIDAQYARLVNNILSDVDARAGLFHSSLPLTVFPDYDVALKTGTTNDYRDAWAIGYTPTLVTGVWAGNNDNTPMQSQGGSILAAVPIWHNFMIEALKAQPRQAFGRPEPVVESKPMLNGEYMADNQIHSILHYIDKSDPLGEFPSEPSGDPQFANWESAVLKWAATNIPDFSTSYNQNSAQKGEGGQAAFLSSSSPPTVKILNPQVGGFIASPVSVIAEMSSPYQIKKINLYFNGNLVEGVLGDFGNNYRLEKIFSPLNLEPQNSISVEIFDEKDRQSKTEVIVYEQPTP